MTGKMATKTWKAMAAARMPSAPSATPTTKKRKTFQALMPSNPHGWMRSRGATRSHLNGVFNQASWAAHSCLVAAREADVQRHWTVGEPAEGHEVDALSP